MNSLCPQRNLVIGSNRYPPKTIPASAVVPGVDLDRADARGRSRCPVGRGDGDRSVPDDAVSAGEGSAHYLGALNLISLLDWFRGPSDAPYNPPRSVIERCRTRKTLCSMVLEAMLRWGSPDEPRGTHGIEARSGRCGLCSGAAILATAQRYASVEGCAVTPK